MNTLVVLAITVFVGCAGYLLLPVVLAWLVPIEKSSRALFVQELKKHGIDHRTVPDSLKQEIIDSALHTAWASGRQQSAAYKAHVVQSIEFQAEVIAIYLQNPALFKSLDLDGSHQQLYDRHAFKIA